MKKNLHKNLMITERLFIIVFIFFLLIFTGCKEKEPLESIQREDDQIIDKLNKLIDKDLPSKIAGYSFILFDDKGKLWSAEGGFANIEKGIKFDENTVIYTGEISQQVTISEILKLYEENKIDIEKEVSFYLPEFFEGGSDRLKKIGDLKISTIIKGLTGFASISPESLKNYRFDKDLKNYLEKSNQIYPENVKYTESPLFIDLLGLVIQKIGGKDFSSFMDYQIFIPNKMLSSSYSPDKKLKNVSLFYSSIIMPQDDSLRDSVIKGNLNILSPSTSMRSSTGDLARFYSLFIDEDPGNEFLSRNTINYCFTPVYQGQLDMEGFETGVGWKLTNTDLDYAGKVAYFTGSFLAHRVFIILLPDHNLGLVCACNAYSWEEKGDLYTLAVNILKEYIKMKFNIEPPSFAKPAEKQIPENIKKKISGFYFSDKGILMLDVKGNELHLSYKGGYSTFYYFKDNIFLPVEQNTYKEIEFIHPDRLILRFDTKAKLVMQKLITENYDSSFSPVTGIYKAQDMYAYPASFMIKQYSNFYVIITDDAKEHLLVPISKNEAKILCDKTSILYGKKLYIDESGEVMLDNAKYSIMKK